MKLLQYPFGDKKQSKYASTNHELKEVLFAQKFTQKGGKFLLASDFQEIKAYLNDILIENEWSKEEIIGISTSFSERFKINCLNSKQPINNKVVFLDCEYLLSNTGGVLVCDKQIRNYKNKDLPLSLIIYADINQLVSDLSEGMTKLKQKYSKEIPSNITTIEPKNPNEINNAYSKTNRIKNIYLILEETQKK